MRLFRLLHSPSDVPSRQLTPPLSLSSLYQFLSLSLSPSLSLSIVRVVEQSPTCFGVQTYKNRSATVASQPAVVLDCVRVSILNFQCSFSFLCSLFRLSFPSPPPPGRNWRLRFSCDPSAVTGYCSHHGDWLQSSSGHHAMARRLEGTQADLPERPRESGWLCG